jgi:hypothetical protein
MLRSSHGQETAASRFLPFLFEEEATMTGRENRKQRREAERKARKLANKQGQPSAIPAEPPSPPVAAPPAPHPTALALMAEMRAKADRELEDEFGADFVAHARQVSDRIASRLGFPTSGARTQANRANAQRSTGPRTEKGKLASSRNALKHGLSTGTILIPGEDGNEFEAFRDALRHEHQPADATERILVDQLAQSHWLLQRAIRFQNECFTPDGVDEKRLSLFLRYGSAHQRAFHKALNALLRLKKERRKALPARTKHEFSLEDRFVSQNEGSRPATPPPAGFVSYSGPSVSTDVLDSGETDAWNSRFPRDPFFAAA